MNSDEERATSVDQIIREIRDTLTVAEADEEPIEPRGCAMAFLVAGFLWIVIFAVAALVVKAIVG